MTTKFWATALFLLPKEVENFAKHKISPQKIAMDLRNFDKSGHSVTAGQRNFILQEFAHSNKKKTFIFVLTNKMNIEISLEVGDVNSFVRF